ncbi:TetR/AcrR family transcriptional regulator [Paenibacillus sp. 28ISP30-2]|nr:TetR/AcrR family transcriptional regulator [Paenibacillus sp. 28ISP30-2]
MKKGDRTREHIIIKSAEVFNQKGYAGTSLNDIIADTGIKKGGIYRHFASKDEIALEAYNYAASIVTRKILEAADHEQSASGRLIAFFRVYEDVINDPPFIGGCPMQNTAVESDDTHPELDRKSKRLNPSPVSEHRMPPFA